MKKNRIAGLTLLEVIVAMAILAVVLAVTFGLLFSFSHTATDQSIRGDLEMRGRTFVDFCKRDFVNGVFNVKTSVAAEPPGDGSAAGVDILGIVGGTSGTEVRYQFPVDRGGDGSALYGYSAKLGTDSAAVNRTCVIRFEAHTILRESNLATTTVTQPAADWDGSGTGWPSPTTLDSSTEVNANYDINRDGDKTDTFLLGYIKRYVVSPTGTKLESESLSDRVLLRYISSTAIYSSLGDTETDTLFSYLPAGTIPSTSAKEIKITVWHGNFDELKKNFFTSKCSESIRFRNKQA